MKELLKYNFSYYSTEHWVIIFMTKTISLVYKRESIPYQNDDYQSLLSQ